MAKKKEKKREFYANFEELHPEMSPAEVKAAYREYKTQKKEAKRMRRD